MTENIIWLTGLVSAGKTTIINEVIKEMDKSVVLLDGDLLRKFVSPDLGYSIRDRNKQMDRLYGIARVISYNNILSIVCTNTPPTDRMKDVLTIYIKSDLDVCKQRDCKNLYKRAEKGEIKNLPGIDLKYHEPKNPFLTLETDKHTIDECVKKMLEKLKGEGII